MHETLSCFPRESDVVTRTDGVHSNATLAVVITLRFVFFSRSTKFPILSRD